MKQTIRRQAADNDYFHPDFHGALSCSIDYLQDRFGVAAVREFLRDFTLSFYAPLRQALLAQGLPALHRHFVELYQREGGRADFKLTEDYLLIKVTACPAVEHLRRHGYPVARLFHETTRTVNQALCEGTPYEAELLDYDEQTGRSVQCFRPRETPS